MSPQNTSTLSSVVDRFVHLLNRRSLAFVIVSAGALVIGSLVAYGVSNQNANDSGVSRLSSTSTTSTTLAVASTWKVPSSETTAPIVLTPGGAFGGSGNFNAITCIAASTCIAVGGDDNLQGVSSTLSGGTTWSAGSVQAGLPDLEAVSCSSASACVAVGQGVSAISTDGGATWKASSIPDGATTLLGVSCPTSNFCVAVGVAPGDNGPYEGELLTSNDGGVTWSNPAVPSSTGALGAVDCPSASFCVAVGASVLVSTDGGQTWSSRAVSGGSGVLRSVSCSSPTTCVAIGANPIGAQVPSASANAVLTTDGGTTWSTEVMPAGSANLFALSCNATRCEAAGTSTTGVGAEILASTNGGATWHADSAGAAGFTAVSAISCLSGSNCVFVGTSQGSPEAATSSSGIISHERAVTSLVRRQKVES